MFEEQVRWACDAGVDYVVGETFSWGQEAMIALEVIKAAKQTAVITLAMHQEDVTREGWSAPDACRRLADAGADVVGLNCIRGPATMLSLLEAIRGVVKSPLAALPVPYRTTPQQPSFQSLRDPHWHGDWGARPFPTALDPFVCNRFEIAEFGRGALALDIRYLGVCCGAGPHHIRALAEAVGKRPPASRYSADMSKHAFLGSHERIRDVQKAYANKL
jgi:betaine-homocysteine S-methyltransferase